MSDGGNMAQAGTGAACGGMLCSVTLPCRWRDQSDTSSGAEGSSARSNPVARNYSVLN
ncbi:TPA: hypothetical protein P7Q58_004874 [Escherichia coli]|uniref:hypothetical protein n=1 Tax=Escherichia coli TaxID=562 RepID=UPI0037C05A4E|nr:hypothetical protein [Escherichia coli]